MSGIVAAGHPLTAEAGARVLREGGNAVDAAVAAMLASFVAEPLLTGPGAGGYMLVAGAGRAAGAAGLLRRRAGRGATRAARAELVPIEVSFGDAAQVFNVGAGVVRRLRQPGRASRRRCARWGTHAARRARRARRAALARDGRRAQRAAGLRVRDPRARSCARRPRRRALFAPDGRVLREGERVRSRRAGRRDRALRRARARRPFYTGDIARGGRRAGVERARRHADRARTSPPTSASAREPVRVALPRPRRAHQPAAVGRRDAAVALALALLERGRRPPAPRSSSTAMEAAQASARPSSSRAWREPASSSASWPRGWARRRTSRCSTATGAPAR